MKDGVECFACALGGHVAGVDKWSMVGSIAAAWKRNLNTIQKKVLWAHFVRPQQVGKRMSPIQQLNSPTGMALVSQHRSQVNSSQHWLALKEPDLVKTPRLRQGGTPG